MNRTQAPRRYRAALFDLDGTLIDSIADIANSFNHILSQRGLPTHPVDAYRYFIGNGARELVRRALPKTADSEGIIDECLAAYREVYARDWMRTTHPYPGVAGLLEALEERDVALAVISNKPHADSQKCVIEFFGAERFAVVLGQSERYPKKPDPTGALAIASQLGVVPAQCMLVGDSDVDMKTARAAGMLPVGVAWGFREISELESSGAGAIVQRPGEIEALFDSAPAEE